jgi:uncharacterized protein YaaR (DUF327 family)
MEKNGRINLQRIYTFKRSKSKKSKHMTKNGLNKQKLMKKLEKVIVKNKRIKQTRGRETLKTYKKVAEKRGGILKAAIFLTASFKIAGKTCFLY